MACPLCGLKDWHLYCCRTQRRLCCWEKTLKCCNSIFFFVILLCCINRLVSVLQSLPLSQVWDIKQCFSEEFKSRSVSIYTDSWNEKKNWVPVKKKTVGGCPRSPHTEHISCPRPGVRSGVAADLFSRGEERCDPPQGNNNTAWSQAGRARSLYQLCLYSSWAVWLKGKEHIRYKCSIVLQR